ncbi:MAG: FAD-dependent oxidoreductase [Alphaproteobacteria bacterium]|nr:FAD-dependent oxidoreductase [Alphaproteobacteria bacterium]
MLNERRLNIAVVGTGISGLSAAWLLGQRHNVTVFEKASWVGGHSNTFDARLNGRTIPVDTGFIVYNNLTYPNLTALFDHLGVPTEASGMSFSASIDGGRFEYSGNTVWTMFAQKRNVLRPMFWHMIFDIIRFYRGVVGDTIDAGRTSGTIGDYLRARNYGEAFAKLHLLPVAACIWSASYDEILNFPLAAFVNFFQSHGLLELRDANRPKWRTVTGGSRVYVEKIAASYRDRIRLNCGVRSVRRHHEFVEVTTDAGTDEVFDHVVIAAHAPDALAMLANPIADESRVLGALKYAQNRAVLHTDSSLMPRRSAAWASWNFLADSATIGKGGVSLTYWMNYLQNIDRAFPIFVTLNPPRTPRDGTVLAEFDYEHPIFNHAALDAQARLWSLQGQNRTWFCGAYFGHGFHEDGLQSGLAVGEALGGIRRPWSVKNESYRIRVGETVGAAA